MSEKIIGIDLGTTNSAVAVIQDGKATMLPIKKDEQLLASVVGMSPENALLVGAPARNQWVVAPDRTVRSIKRKMGSQEVVMMAGVAYKPQEISAFILKEIKVAAEQALGHLEPIDAGGFGNIFTSDFSNFEICNCLVVLHLER